MSATILQNFKSGAAYYGTMLLRTFDAWSDDHGSRMGAALAYYALFSLAPILLIAVTVAGSVLGDVEAQDAVFKQVQAYVGTQGAQTVRDLMGAMAAIKSGFWGAVVSVSALFFAATGMVDELQSALNEIWRVEPPQRPWLALVRRRALTLGFVLGNSLLLLLALLLGTFVAALGKYMSAILPVPEAALHAMNFALSSGVTTLLFAMVYKYLPDARIAWRDVWTGAGVTALLLALGDLGVGVYLGKSDPTSAFGAAGSLILILVWTFYCAQLLYFGAEFTRVHARARGLAAGGGPPSVPLRR